MAQFKRIAGSFAIILIAHWAYVLLAVPWIEPSGNTHADGAISEQQHRVATRIADLQMAQIQGLFPPDAWELKNPKILETDRGMLLMQDYRNLGDGRVELHPLTIVYSPEVAEGVDEEQAKRQSVILEAPGGALLQFDQPLNFSQPRPVRMIKGQIFGRVTIRSDWKDLGPQDDLKIITSEVEMSETTISTQQGVTFRWGPHFGSGKQMLIKMLTDPSKPAGGSGPNFSGIDSFELKKVERLHLDIGQSDPKKGNTTSMPVEIACAGTFLFDVTHHVATFCDRVDVAKLNPIGPPDQIAGDRLSVYFANRGKPAEGNPAPAANSGSLDIAPERIEVLGKPVIVRAPSQQANASGEHLEYNLITKAVKLEGGPEVVLQQKSNEIHAQSLFYQAGAAGHVGQVLAQGPGWLRAQPDNHPEQQLEAIWRNQLRVEPDNDKQVLSLTGGADLSYQGVGKLSAKDIYFWFVETVDPGSEQCKQHPEKMFARDNVKMNWSDLSGNVDQLEVWFEEHRAVAERPPEDSSATIAATGPHIASPSPAMPSNATPGNPQSSQSAAPPPPARHFEVTGRLIQARVLLDQGQQAVLSDLTLQDQVCLLETQTANPGERPMMLQGDRIQATNASLPTGSVVVTGAKAHFEARGFGLTGTNIQLDRGKNSLKISGPGQMDLPMAGGFSLQGSTSAVAGTMNVTWQKEMRFDGQVATFEHEVRAVSPTQNLKTEVMHARLSRPIDFQNHNAREKPQVEEIQCCGGVLLEDREFDPMQQLTAHNQLSVSDLIVNVFNGATKAGGPGWLNAVFFNNGALPGMPPAAQQEPGQLNCLHIVFQKSISGNLPVKNGPFLNLTFSDQVQMTYGPVNDWNAMLTTNDPKKLGPGGLVAQCGQFTFAETPILRGNRRTFGIQMVDNVEVDGVIDDSEFYACGSRATYEEGKDVLILEGDGRSEAKLYQQLEPGAPRSENTARLIQYNLRTKSLHVDGVRSLEISQPPGGGIRR